MFQIQYTKQALKFLPKLEHLENVPPTDDELYALQEYHNGNPEYTASFSTDDVIHELGL